MANAILNFHFDFPGTSLIPFLWNLPNSGLWFHKTAWVSLYLRRPNAFWDQSGEELKIGSSPLSLRQFCFYWRSLSLACRHFFVYLLCIVFKEPWVFAISLERWMDLSPNLSTGEPVFVSKVETQQWKFLCWWCWSHRCSPREEAIASWQEKL